MHTYLRYQITLATISLEEKDVAALADDPSDSRGKTMVAGAGAPLVILPERPLSFPCHRFQSQCGSILADLQYTLVKKA